jgi:CHAD domain-containing protein
MMPHLKKSEPPVKALRRVCRGHVVAALDWLRKTGRPSAIHRVRKEIKKSRAIVRLVGDTKGRGANRKTAKNLRQVAHRLDGSRDARVMLQELKKLANGNAAQFLETRRALLKHSRREDRRFHKHASVAAKRLLRKAERRVRKLKFAASGWAAIEPGLKRNYRRAQAMLKLAGRRPLPKNFHDWRKHVKNFRYHLEMLCPEWPPEIRALTGKLDRLGDCLGEDHDLFMLDQFVAGQGVAREAAGLNRRITARQKKLRAEALKLGAAVFSEPAAVVCRRLEQHWDAWRDQPADR